MVLIILLNLTLITFTLFLIFMERLLIRYGECKVIINKEKTYSAEEGETLLEFLGRKKIFIPSACGGKATCGHCKVKVLSGAGNILPTEKVFVNLEEAKSGVRLACQIKIKEPVEIYLPEYLFAAKEYMGRVIEKKDLTYDIKFLRIKLLNQERINFKAGQYIQLKIPGTEEFRAYSIASPPYIDDYLELIVRLIPGGLCSTYVHMALEIGDIVNFAGPFGEFFLHEESEKEIICVGGGSGMAPLRSIIYYLRKKKMPRRVIYFFGARRKCDLYYTEEFRELEREYSNFKYVPALSEPKADDHWEGDTGLITQVVERYIRDATNSEAYLCGPPMMIEAALKVLTKKGIKPENIYYDKF